MESESYRFLSASRTGRRIGSVILNLDKATYNLNSDILVITRIPEFLFPSV